ncbi:MAG TPA: response regulator [bacterium]|nr:response regulator [bacterium]
MEGAVGPRVLVVDDEEALRRLLRATLAARGYRVFEASSGQGALVTAGAVHSDLVILDLGLPDLDGLDVIRRLREWSSTPIVVLSVRDRDDDKVAALDAGADDYLTKPFSTLELLARMRAALRHAARSGNEAVIATGALTVDVVRRRVTVAGRQVALTPVGYSLLKALALSAGKVRVHRHLLREVWGPAYEHDLSLLRVSVSKLRHKVESDPARPQYILTEAGVGYRLRVPA